jgi:hypothetical protein
VIAAENFGVSIVSMKGSLDAYINKNFGDKLWVGNLIRTNC